MNTYNLKNFIVKILLVLVPFIFFGCSTAMRTTADNFTFKRTKSIQVLSNSEVAGDIHLSVAALVMKMRHKRLHSNRVSFDKNGNHLVYESDFNYKGFRWDMLKIATYKTIDKRPHITTFQLQGMLSFSDKLGRITSSLFDMTYEVKNKKTIRILDSEIFDSFMTTNNVLTFFVPIQKLERNTSVLRSFPKLLAFAKRNAIRLQANSIEIEQYKHTSFIQRSKGNLPNKQISGKFCAIVFCMERFPSSSLFSVSLGDKTGKIYKENDVPIVPIYHNYNGWPVAFIGFDANIRSNTDIFTINAFYQKNKYATKKLIGKFKNTMNYKKRYIKHGPLARGKLLLNLNVKNNAKIVQARLYALGYYKGSIDGAFGRNSKRALSNFVHDRLRKNYINWNMKIQRVLFKGSGM